MICNTQSWLHCSNFLKLHCKTSSNNDDKTLQDSSSWSLLVWLAYPMDLHGKPCTALETASCTIYCICYNNREAMESLTVWSLCFVAQMYMDKLMPLCDSRIYIQLSLQKKRYINTLKCELCLLNNTWNTMAKAKNPIADLVSPWNVFPHLKCT